MNKFNEIRTRNELAIFIDVPIRTLTYILYIKRVNNCYNSFEIPKKSGGVRCIDAPDNELKEIQRKLAMKLWEYHYGNQISNEISSKVSHGFEKQKGIITNAQIHRKKKYIVNIDIENFFNSFHFGRVRGYFEKNRNFNLSRDVSTIIAQLVCYNGTLPQGAPTSPIITNLICNILDMRIIHVAKKYKLDYTRYADDLSFSTNDNFFIVNVDQFIKDVTEVINNFGLNVNNKKTRFTFRDSKQTVTGLVVNEKINVERNYYKSTRAMAENLYKEGHYYINGELGSINQLEGRFAFINQLSHYNNKLNNEKLSFWKHSSREIQYRKFLCYKYFFANSKPLIATEGKTDILYIKSALRKYYNRYPNLISKNDDSFIYKISFLKRTKRLEYFLNIALDGADTLKNIYNLTCGKCNYPNYGKIFIEKSNKKPHNPVILIFDNEQVKDRPLKAFLNHVGLKDTTLNEKQLGINVIDNLYVLTHSLVKNKIFCEIEDLFDDEVLSRKIEGKSFSREKEIDSAKYYTKDTFSKIVYNDYENINFDNFIPMLDKLEEIVKNYHL